MRKIFAALLLISFAASSSFASSTAVSKGDYTKTGRSMFPYDANGAQGPAAIGKMSTGVYIAWATLTTSYIIKTQHLSGSKIFATASDSTAINWKPITGVKGQDITAPPAAATNSALINEGGWSVM